MRPSTLISGSGATGGHEERSNSDRPPCDRSSLLVGRTPPEFRVPRGARTAPLGRQSDRRRTPAPDTEKGREEESLLRGPQGKEGEEVGAARNAGPLADRCTETSPRRPEGGVRRPERPSRAGSTGGG